ncbi:MAG TPA: winged helix-turn-helix domain-containing protein [Pirellulales bacterium]|nr:winged helix-turn-helix domain-containing protein [Pirellulales bacterium]
MDAASRRRDRSVIEVHINRPRGKLSRKFHDSLIETVRGRGDAIRAT